MQNEPVLEKNIEGNKFWYLNDKLHREDGPAVKYLDGYKAWYLNGLRHRTDGPAIEFPNGRKEWYLNHKFYTFEEWLEITPISSQVKIKLRLQYAK